MSVRVDTSPVAVDVRIGGMDRLWGFRKQIEVPLARVEEARVVPADEAKADLRLRTAGLGMPGLAAVGHFRGRERRRQWWRVYRGDRVVVIDLDPASAFDRLVLEIEDPETTAALVNAARRRSSTDG
jgi:hypothetical protein